MIVFDKHKIILQHRPDLPDNPNYPDNYDSCMKTCIAHLSGIECASPVVFYKDGYVVRHPDLSPELSSRDHLIPFMAAMYFRGYRPRMNYKYNINKDLLISPSVQWFMRKCGGDESYSWLGDKMIRLDIWWAAKNPDKELNQLFCMCLVLGKEYVQLLCNSHPDWRKNLRDYWSGWRDEHEIYEAFTKRIEREL